MNEGGDLETKVNFDHYELDSAEEISGVTETQKTFRPELVRVTSPVYKKSSIGNYCGPAILHFSGPTELEIAKEIVVGAYQELLNREGINLEAASSEDSFSQKAGPGFRIYLIGQFWRALGYVVQKDETTFEVTNPKLSTYSGYKRLVEGFDTMFDGFIAESSEATLQ